MAETELIRWIEGQASRPGNVERICPGIHITSDKWQSEWNDDYLNEYSQQRYDYISDYECFLSYPINGIPQAGKIWDNLQAQKRRGTALAITDIAHFTRAGDAIIQDGGFRGGAKQFDTIKGNRVKAQLSWWNPVFTPIIIRQVQDHFGTVMRPFLSADADDEDKLKRQFATSNAFKLKPERYGRFYFQYGIQELCEEYQRCCGSRELDFRILGTFGYKQEVEHAVLVCSREAGASRFSAYPRVATPAEDVDNKAVVTHDPNNRTPWTWKAEATATEIERLFRHEQQFPRYRRWDHVSFAFHIPEDCGNVMKVRHLESHCKELPNWRY